MLLRIYDSLSDYYSDIDNDEVIMCIFLMNIGYIDYYNDDLFSISNNNLSLNLASIYDEGEDIHKTKLSLRYRYEY